MGKPHTIASTELRHPMTGQVLVLQAHDDGAFGLVLPPRDDNAREWGMSRNFTGGRTGTRMKVREIPGVSEDADL